MTSLIDSDLYYVKRFDVIRFHIIYSPSFCFRISNRNSRVRFCIYHPQLYQTAVWLLCAILFIAQQGQVAAQGLQLMTGGGSDALEIQADDTLEWLRDKRAYIARGNARAQRGAVVLHAQILRALYHDGPDGNPVLYRLEAEGNVRLESPNERAQGDRGFYDVQAQRLELWGGDLKLQTRKDLIRARDRLIYDETALVAIATGQASAVRGDQGIYAEILTAYFIKQKNDILVQRIRAEQNVCIQSANAIGRGQLGRYDVMNQTAILEQGVEIIQNGAMVAGEVAEVDLRTGISRLRNKKPESSSQKVPSDRPRRRIIAHLPIRGGAVPGDINRKTVVQNADISSTPRPSRLKQCR